MKWRDVTFWGKQGWLVGNPPYVQVFEAEYRHLDGSIDYRVRVWVEGDRSDWVFDNPDDQFKKLDEIAHFYWRNDRRMIHEDLDDPKYHMRYFEGVPR